MDFMLTNEPGLLYTESAFASSVKPTVPIPKGGIDIKTTKYNTSYSLWKAAEQRKELQDALKTLNKKAFPGHWKPHIPHVLRTNARLNKECGRRS